MNRKDYHPRLVYLQKFVKYTRRKHQKYSFGHRRAIFSRYKQLCKAMELRKGYYDVDY